jgi:predicted Zn finger-like uncharacterized protein
VQVIVVCPNCGARYRLSDAALARNARLRCAACDYRWVPEAGEPEAAAPPPRRITEADEEEAFAAVQEQMHARWQTPEPADPPTGSDSADPDDTDSGTANSWADDQDVDNDSDDAVDGRSDGVVAKTVVAVISGIALSVVAVGLWLGQINLAGIPVIGALVDHFDPPAALQLVVTGEATLLPSGKRLLEISGTIRNRTGAEAWVPPLKATLSGPAGVALRWSIAPPVATLAPGHAVEFGSTVTGFPADATALSIRTGR